MQVDIISLFPQIFSLINHGVCGRAIRNKSIEIKHWDPRNYTKDTHKSVDDRPFGGGAGMIMSYPPLARTIKEISKERSKTHTIYLSPQGKPITQKDIEELVKKPQITFLAGRYAGVDQRIIDRYVDKEYSIGDYILSGGELPTLVMIDALARLMPGTLGNDESTTEDSFSNGLLAGPAYTRPACIDGQSVPKVLISGDHQAIEHWRRKESLRKTWQIRPDLIKRHVLDAESQAILDELKKGNMS